MLDFERYEVLTFDCHGTLIDWESGIVPALRAVLGAHHLTRTDAEILELYAQLEPQAQQPYQRYRDVLETVVTGFGERLGFSPSAAEVACLHSSLPDWPPFPDTIEALTTLARRYRLAVISNTDDDLFAQTAKRLRVGFDWVITAEHSRAYKPAPAIFDKALRLIGVGQDRISACRREYLGSIA